MKLLASLPAKLVYLGRAESCISGQANNGKSHNRVREPRRRTLFTLLGGEVPKTVRHPSLLMESRFVRRGGNESFSYRPPDAVSLRFFIITLHNEKKS